MDELEVGTKIKGRYLLKELLGRGGFGEVWLTFDEILECDTAIKIYVSLDSQGIAEFKSEYTTTQELHH
ncbi:MAG: serine/threonine protein kinase, partial [Bacteroidales bacterium]|nr:serine/threonine protein kinase [Bacteroidales bacterium]